MILGKLLGRIITEYMGARWTVQQDLTEVIGIAHEVYLYIHELALVYKMKITHLDQGL